MSGASSPPLPVGSLITSHRVIDATEAEQNVLRSVKPVLAANIDTYVTFKKQYLVGLFKVCAPLNDQS
jgi:hypothetical protein